MAHQQGWPLWRPMVPHGRGWSKPMGTHGCGLPKPMGTHGHGWPKPSLPARSVAHCQLAVTGVGCECALSSP